MISHLSDEQLVASALAESDRAAAVHLQQCSECREGLQSLQGAIGAWVEDVGERSGASEIFWRRQRAAIAARLERRTSARPWNYLPWATATLALVLVAAVASYRRSAPAVNMPRRLTTTHSC